MHGLVVINICFASCDSDCFVVYCWNATDNISPCSFSDLCRSFWEKSPGSSVSTQVFQENFCFGSSRGKTLNFIHSRCIGCLTPSFQSSV